MIVASDKQSYIITLIHIILISVLGIYFHFVPNSFLKSLPISLTKTSLHLFVKNNDVSVSKQVIEFRLNLLQKSTHVGKSFVDELKSHFSSSDIYF